jgi:hypothetical protein
LTIPLVKLADNCHIGTQKDDFGRGNAAYLRCSVARVCVERNKKGQNGVAPCSASAECVNPHGVGGVDLDLLLRLESAHRGLMLIDHVEDSETIRFARLARKRSRRGAPVYCDENETAALERHQT